MEVIHFERSSTEYRLNILEAIAKKIVDRLGLVVEIDEHQAEPDLRSDLPQPEILDGATHPFVGFCAAGDRDAIPLGVI